jgi:hypothetical protein
MTTPGSIDGGLPHPYRIMYSELFAWTYGTLLQVACFITQSTPCSWIFQANCAAEYRDGRARCHARKARPELFRLFKEDGNN